MSINLYLGTFVSDRKIKLSDTFTHEFKETDNNFLFELFSKVFLTITKKTNDESLLEEFYRNLFGYQVSMSNLSLESYESKYLGRQTSFPMIKMEENFIVEKSSGKNINLDEEMIDRYGKYLEDNLLIRYVRFTITHNFHNE
ncbi:MAG: hypothetical protein K9J38_01255 [Polynucleobacter sp.]|nr:hypothetical protein [Polynucleobacter sp.]